MTDFSVSDIRKSNSAYERMLGISESFLSPYELGNKQIPNEDGEEERNIFTKKNLKDLKEYFNSLRTARSIRVFLDMGGSAIKKKIEYEYGFKYLAVGSSRVVYQTPAGTVLKIAYNHEGVSQNRAEAHDRNVKNAYGCFPHIFWVSDNCLAIECENTFPLSNEEKFEKITGINFDEYIKALKYIQFIVATGFKRFENLEGNEMRPTKERNLDYIADDRMVAEGVSIELNRRGGNEYAKKALKNLMHYVTTKNSSREYIIGDLSSTFNWGIVYRSGGTACVPLDTGGTSYVLNLHYPK